MPANAIFGGLPPGSGDWMRQNGQWVPTSSVIPGYSSMGTYPSLPATRSGLTPLGGTTSSGPDIYGSRIAPIGTPNPYGDLSRIYPGLANANALVSGDITHQLMGELSPATINAIHNAAAQFGVANGMPGSVGYGGTLSSNLGLRDIGRSVEDQILHGIEGYNRTIPTVSSTQTVRPELQTEIAATNATNAAAPNPAAAGSHAEQLFRDYMARFTNPSGGTFQNPLDARPWWDKGNTAGTGWNSNFGTYDWVTSSRYK